MASRSPSPEPRRRDDTQGRLRRESPARGEHVAVEQQREHGSYPLTSSHSGASHRPKHPDSSSHHHKSHSRSRKHSDSSRRHSARSRSRSKSPPPSSTSKRHHDHMSKRSRSRSPQEESEAARRSRSRSRSGSPHGGNRRTHSRRSRSKSPVVSSSSSSQRRRDHGSSRRSRSRSRSKSPSSSRHRRDHSRRSRSRSRSPPSGHGKRSWDHRQGWQSSQGRGGYRGGRGYHKSRFRTSTPVVTSTPVAGKDSSQSQSQEPLFAPPLVHRERDPNSEKLTPEEKLERALAAARAVKSKMPQPPISTLSATPSAVPLSNPLLKAPALPQKKKLMWNKKTSTSNQWEGVSLGEEGENSETQAKFRRLMGMGKGDSASSTSQQSQSAPGGQSEMKEKHEKLRRDLEQQYETSRYMTHLARGSGLGFGFSSSS